MIINNNPYYDDPNVIVSDLLPSGYSFISYVATQGVYNNVTGNWNVGILQALQSAEIAITVKVNSDGNYKNIATVSGQNPDPDLNNNSDFAEIQKKIADLDASKTDGVSYYQPGQELNYVITVINKGPAVAYEVKVLCLKVVQIVSSSCCVLYEGTKLLNLSTKTIRANVIL